MAKSVRRLRSGEVSAALRVGFMRRTQFGHVITNAQEFADVVEQILDSENIIMVKELKDDRTTPPEVPPADI
jgi:hypothetical protein